METAKLGIIGCGMISDAYFKGIAAYDGYEVKACADLREEAARAKAEKHGVLAVGIDEMLADPEIEAVINLTVPAAHAPLNLRILEAGKHAYCEKPFALNREEGLKVLEYARSSNLRVSCAPDTVLGAGQQTARALIDAGLIGEPRAGIINMLSAGVDLWHTNPAFYYQPGGGPLLDMGPYYHTALVNLLGPVRSVSARTSRAQKERNTVHGGIVPVEVPTHYAGVLEFDNHVLVNSVFSFDTPGGGTLPWIQIYGSEGTLSIPDPNMFDGECQIRLAKKTHSWDPMPWEVHTREFKHFGGRGLGPIDLVASARAGLEPRASGAMAFHVLDVLLAYHESDLAGQPLTIQSTCERPRPVPENLPDKTWQA